MTAGVLGGDEIHSSVQNRLDARPVALVVQKATDLLRHDGADAVHRLQLRGGGGPHALEAPEAAGEFARDRGPYLGDTQAVEKAVEFDRLLELNGLGQIRRRLLGEPFQLLEVIGGKIEQVGQLLDQPAIYEKVRRLLPQPFDVEARP